MVGALDEHSYVAIVDVVVVGRHVEIDQETRPKRVVDVEEVESVGGDEEGVVLQEEGLAVKGFVFVGLQLKEELVLVCERVHAVLRAGKEDLVVEVLEGAARLVESVGEGDIDSLVVN